MYPILISGNEETSIPIEIEHIRHEDLRHLYLKYHSQTKAISIPTEIERKTKEIIQKINQEIIANIVLKSSDFKRRNEEMHEKLFLETKSEWFKPEYFHLMERLIVKTKPLQAIIQKKSLFLIGRKGSGKSTIVDVLPIIKQNEISFNIPINLDNFQLEKTYAIFYSSPDLFINSNFIVSKLTAFKYIWDVFLRLSVLVRLSIFANELADRRVFRIVKFLEDNYDLKTDEIAKDEKKIYADLYHSTFDLFISFIAKSKEISQKSVNKTFKLNRLVSLKNFRKHCIPDEFVIEQFDDILSKFDKKPLITLDGYDTESDEFIRDGHYIGDHALRVNFERLWLHSLILLILDKGVKGEMEEKFYTSFYYCITIPKDRFYSIKKDDRDSYRHRGKFILVRWTGIELAILVRKRLEEMTEWETEIDTKPKDRLLSIIKNKFPQLFKDITIDFEKTIHIQDLFCYILRHSFWRPRDVLFIFGMLLNAINDRLVKDLDIDVSFTKAIIREAAFDIIENEFINEFKALYKNFKDVLYGFWKSQQFLNYDNIYQTLNRLDLEAHDRFSTLKDMNEKIEFLFDIGFIGVQVPVELKRKLQTHDFAFNFNESNFLRDKIKRPDYNKTTFVIHPIFRDFLRLQVDKNSPPVLLYNWDYLEKNETINHHIKIV